nr:PX domain-containing protein 1 [Zonotrichia albicollis]
MLLEAPSGMPSRQTIIKRPKESQAPAVYSLPPVFPLCAGAPSRWRCRFGCRGLHRGHGGGADPSCRLTAWQSPSSSLSWPGRRLKEKNKNRKKNFWGHCEEKKMPRYVCGVYENVPRRKRRISPRGDRRVRRRAKNKDWCRLKLFVEAVSTLCVFDGSVVPAFVYAYDLFTLFLGLITIKEAHDIEARLNEVEKLLKTIINMPWKYSRSEVVLTFFERSPLDQVLKNDNVHKIQPSFQSPVKISEIMRSNGFCLANTETIVIDHSIPNGKEKHLDVDSAEHLFESVSDFTSELEDSDDPTAYVTNLTYYHLVPFETDILD